MEQQSEDRIVTVSKRGVEVEGEETPKKYTKAQRVLAWVGIGLLLAMYLVNLVLAFIDGEAAKKMLLCSSVLTILIPIILYFFMLMIKKRK